MRMKQLLRTAAVLLVALFFWRLVGVETDLATLRAGVANTHAAPSPGAGGGQRESLPIAAVAAPVEDVPTAPASDAASANPTGRERAVEELQQAKVRIAELEATVKELSEAWNQFAAEEENKRVMEERMRQKYEEDLRAAAAALEKNIKQVEGAATLDEATARIRSRALAEQYRELSKSRK